MLSIRHRMSLVSFLCKSSLQLCNWFSFLTVSVIETFKQLQEYPLRPFVVSSITGTNFAIPVETKTNIIQLFFESIYISFSGNGRMLPCFQCVLLGRKAKTVKTHWVQYVKTFQSLITAINIRSNIS